MKKTLLFLLSTFYIAALPAQDSSTLVKPDTLPKTGKNIVYMELLGSGFLYSINYERVLWTKEKKAVTARIGLSQRGSFYSKKLNELFAPVALSFLYGKNKSKLELGAGLLAHSNKNGSTREEIKEHGESFPLSPPFEVFPIAIIGYRFQPKTKGIVFRASFTPIVDRLFLPGYFTYNKIHIWWWGGMSIGYIFK